MVEVPKSIFQGDKSTVISIVPFPIKEFKPALYPGVFEVPACYDDSKPQLLIVGTSHHLMHVADQKKPLRVETPSYTVAKSVVDDYLSAQMWTTPDARPGIAWIHGVVLPAEFLTKLKDLLVSLRDNQRRWFLELVKHTDDEYNKYKTNKVVSDQARFAAKVLGLTEKPWMSDTVTALSDTKCPACATRNDPTNAVCSNCRCILDPDKFSKLKFA